jgi:ATP-dependent Clp protease ATP-binding subunit ClpA
MFQIVQLDRIPATITGSESARCKNGDTLHERIIGQKHAVVAVFKCYSSSTFGRIEIQIDQLQVSFFAGPTGW